MLSDDVPVGPVIRAASPANTSSPRVPSSSFSCLSNVYFPVFMVMSLNLFCVYSPTGSQSNSTCSPARSSPAPRTGSALILFPVGFARLTFRYMLQSLKYIDNSSEKKYPWIPRCFQTACPTDVEDRSFEFADMKNIWLLNVWLYFYSQTTAHIISRLKMNKSLSCEYKESVIFAFFCLYGIK